MSFGWIRHRILMDSPRCIPRSPKAGLTRWILTCPRSCTSYLHACEYSATGYFGSEGSDMLEAVGQGTKMADHLSPSVRSAFPSRSIISERSSPSRVRFAAPNNGAPLTAPGRSEQGFLIRGKGSLRTTTQAGHHFAAILVPFFSATDSDIDLYIYCAVHVAIPRYGEGARAVARTKPSVVSSSARHGDKRKRRMKTGARSVSIPRSRSK